MVAIALSSAPKTQSSNPFHMVSLQLGNGRNPPPSSRTPDPSSSSSSSYASAQEIPEAMPMTFKRLRSSLEQSLKTATRSRARAPPPIDDFATGTAKGKGKEKAPEDQHKGQDKDKNTFGILRRLESRVGLRRTTRESTATPTIPLDASHTNASTNATGAHGNNDMATTKSRQAGFTSFATPSLRQASMSSPALHLSSQEMSSPSSQSAAMKPSTSALVVPARDRSRRASIQPRSKEISGPQPLASRHEYRGGTATPDRSGAASPRANNSRPSPLFSPPRGPSPRRNHISPSPPATPTPQSGSRGRLSDLSRKPVTASAAHLPLRSSQSPSPTLRRTVSPTHARAPSKPSVTPASYQAPTSASASASQLSLNSSSQPTTPTPARRPSPRRPSIDAPRRPSIDAPRRPSIDAPQRPSFDTPRRPSADVPRKAGESYQRAAIETQRRPTTSPLPRASSPQSTVRPRATSPHRTPAYTQNRQFNLSTASLISPSTPEQREVIRAATSLLCKELRKAPPHLARIDAQKEWAEVEVRLQPLVRLERVWGKSGSASTSSSQVAVAGNGSNVLSSAGEERERKLFCEALRDGVILCQ